MVLQQLNLVDDHVATTSDILQDCSVSPERTAPGVGQEKEQIVIAFDIGDKENAGNWPRSKKLLTIATGLLLVFNTTLGSSLPSGATDVLKEAFNVPTQEQLTLPVAVFLVGYIFGPIIFGPLSESYGRRLTLLSSFLIYTLFTLACALAPTWPALLTFRFIVGLGAAAPPTVLGGMIADVYPGSTNRGRAVMLLALMTNLGPLTGPIIAGFVSEKGWQWMFWVSLILTSTTWPLMAILPETYGPIILARRAKVLRKSLANDNIRAPLATEKRDLRQILTVVIARPILIIAEPIVAFTDLFLALEYAVYFLYFEAYPLIFKGIYGFSNGKAALAFLPIGLGAALAMLMFLWFDRYHDKAKAEGASWTAKEECRRLPLACAGGPLLAVSQLWLGWTSRRDVHWIVPMLSGIPYGIGVELTFMSLTNYLTDAYDIFSASALASCVFTRNIIAALLLPLASHQMYVHLGINWSCSILGLLGLVFGIIPFIFLRYGPVLRARSAFREQLHARLEQRNGNGLV